MTAGELVLHVYRDGSSVVPSLVLLHAFPLDHRMWDDVAPLLTGGAAVLAPDLPGLGASPDAGTCATALGRDPAPSLETSADAVAAALRAHGVQRAVVAGLSMGGYVALALLERHPDLVAGIALLDTRASADDTDALARRLEVASTVLRQDSVEAVAGMRTALLGATSRGARPELVDRVGQWIADQEPSAVAWSQLAMAARPDRTAVLSSFGRPALVLLGEEDATAPLTAAQPMVDVLADVELVVVPDAGHLTAVEEPAAVASALSRLMDRCAPVAR